MYAGTHTSHICHQFSASNFVFSTFQRPSGELHHLFLNSILYYTGPHHLISILAGNRMLARSIERELETVCLIHKFAGKKDIHRNSFAPKGSWNMSSAETKEPIRFLLGRISGFKHFLWLSIPFQLSCRWFHSGNL